MGAAATHTTCSGSPPPHTDRAESAPPPPMMLWVSHRGWKQGAPRRHPAGQDHALLGTPRLRESTAAPTAATATCIFIFLLPHQQCFTICSGKRNKQKKNPNSCQHICRAPVLPGPGWAVDYNPYFCLLLLASRHLGPSK